MYKISEQVEITNDPKFEGDYENVGKKEIRVQCYKTFYGCKLGLFIIS
jgi:hypothetical protein